MIDRASIMAWNEFVPWTDFAMVEQDLIGESNALKKKIAARYELPVPVLTSWLTVITLWFVDIISPNNDMKEYLINLIRAYQNVDVKAMGFPDHWEQEPLWSK